MEGFLQFRLPSWLRRLVTRLLAIIPALITIIIFGEDSTSRLIVLSQVILSLQLPFAVIPLVMFTSNRRLMGEFVNPLWLKSLAWGVAYKVFWDSCYQFPVKMKEQLLGNPMSCCK
jgi:manganese transport protein